MAKKQRHFDMRLWLFRYWKPLAACLPILIIGVLEPRHAAETFGWVLLVLIVLPAVVGVILGLAVRVWQEWQVMKWRMRRSRELMQSLKVRVEPEHHARVWWVNLKLKIIKLPITFKTETKGEDWTTALGWFIPRKYRNDIIGDILEDCVEMRQIGCTEMRIKVHVVYQWLIAVITLVPSSIVGILWRAKSPPK